MAVEDLVVDSWFIFHRPSAYCPEVIQYCNKIDHSSNSFELEDWYLFVTWDGHYLPLTKKEVMSKVGNLSLEDLLV